MGLNPTAKAVIGTFVNGRNSTDDFLQVASSQGGTVFGWIDSNGIPQGSLAASSSGIGGSIAATQIAVGTGSNTIGGSSNLTYISGTGVLSSAVFNATTGFQISSTATLGQFLRGNGTNFVSAPIQSGDISWNLIGNATGSLVLANGTNATTFNQTSSTTWTWANITPATGFASPASSPVISLVGSAWTGSSSVQDAITIQNVLTQNNAAQQSTLTFSHPATSSFFRNILIDGTWTGFTVSPITDFLSTVILTSTLQSAASSYDGAVFNLTSVGNASAGLTIYSGSFAPTAPSIGMFVTVAGFTNGVNNGRFLVQASSSSTITLYNASGVAETNAATSTTDNMYGGFIGEWRLATTGGASSFDILGTNYGVAHQISVTPNQVNLAFNTEGNATDAGYVRIINNGVTGPTGNHGLEIGGIIDGTGAAPVLLRLGTFGGATGIFATTNNYALGQVICSGQIALSTGAISSGTRATNTLSCAGLSTSTDAIDCTFSGDTNAVTGYAPSASGGLTLKTWVSAGTINVDQINNTGGSITPGAATLNCKGLR